MGARACCFALCLRSASPLVDAHASGPRASPSAEASHSRLHQTTTTLPTNHTRTRAARRATSIGASRRATARSMAGNEKMALEERVALWDHGRQTTDNGQATDNRTQDNPRKKTSSRRPSHLANSQPTICPHRHKLSPQRTQIGAAPPLSS